jgi:hypothetical protein
VLDIQEGRTYYRIISIDSEEEEIEYMLSFKAEPETPHVGHLKDANFEG